MKKTYVVVQMVGDYFRMSVLSSNFAYKKIEMAQEVADHLNKTYMSGHMVYELEVKE